MKHRPLIFLTLIVCSLQAIPAFANEMARQEAREWGLPNFQERELERDLPVRDMIAGTDGTLWLLGRSALWNWDLNKNALKRILLLWEERVLDPSKNSEQLIRLGSDGSSIFVGSTRFVYQIAQAENESAPKVLRYKIPGAAKLLPIGFAGTGDQFMWVTSAKAFLFDRYGKKLQPITMASPLRPSDLLLANDTGDELHVSRDKQIWKVKLNKSLAGESRFGKPQTVQKLSNPVLDLRPIPGGYLAHTSFTVMRQSWAGKRIQTIPVENDRKLVRAYTDTQRHAYLFSDGLAEVYDLNPESVRRYQLSPELVKVASVMLLPNDANLLLLSGGKVTAYSLARSVEAPRVSRK